jgi:hypothetical protein
MLVSNSSNAISRPFLSTSRRRINNQQDCQLRSMPVIKPVINSSSKLTSNQDGMETNKLLINRQCGMSKPMDTSNNGCSINHQQVVVTSAMDNVNKKVDSRTDPHDNRTVPPVRTADFDPTLHRPFAQRILNIVIAVNLKDISLVCVSKV